MKITIIIPIYKVEPYIADCIRSVIAQKNVDLDIVLVDDCSPDNSVKIACDMLDNAGTAYQLVRHEMNQGLSSARNSGIKVAKGEYLYFLDSDDELFGEYALFKLSEIAKVSSAGCIVGSLIEQTTDYVVERNRFSYRRLFSRDEAMRAYFAGNIPVSAWNKLINKQCLLENGLFFHKGVLHEDDLWSFQMALKKISIIMAGDVTYIYKPRPGSIMTGCHIKKVMGSCAVYEQMVTCFSNSFLKKSEKRVVTDFLESFVWRCYKQLFVSSFSIRERRLIYNLLKQIQIKYRVYSVKSFIRRFHIYLPFGIGWGIVVMMVLILRKNNI